MEMILEPGQQIECLQAVDAECLEEIVVGVSFSRGTLKCVAARSRISSSVFSSVGMIKSFDAITRAARRHGKYGCGIRALDELAQSGFDRRFGE